jgi:hypothetical protein
LKELVGVFDETTLNQEAVNRGYADTANEVDRTTRALVALQILQEEGIVVGDELARIQESITGQYLGNRNAVETLKASIGERLLPTTIRLQEVFIGFLDFLDKAIQGLQLFWAALVAADGTAKGFVSTMREFGGIFQALMNPLEFASALVDQFGQSFIDTLSEINPELLGQAADGIDDVGQAARDAAPDLEELAEAFKEAFSDIRELVIDLSQDIAKENRKYLQDLIEDTQKYLFDLQQLYEKLQFDIAKVNRTFNDKIADAQDDYRDKELEAEEDFQEKMRRLRENFLFNLEDALRERDARQILRLIRQFNLRKTQLERENNIEKEQRKRDFEDQIEDIKRQRAIRLRELQIEYEFRRRQMAAEFEFEKRLRLQDHLQRIEEQKQQTRERFAELLRGLQDSGDLTAKEAEILAEVFDEFFGPGGSVPASIDNIISKLEELKTTALTAINEFNNLEGPQIPDAIKTQEGLTFDVNEGKIKSQAKNVTKAFDDELGEDGEVIGIFEYLIGKIKNYVQKDIPDSLSDKEGILGLAAKGVVTVLNMFFGPDGEVEGVFGYLVGIIDSAVKAVITLIQRLRNAIAGLSNIGITSAPNAPTNPTAGPFAKGGTLYADKATTVTFGEAGPEVAQFTPLNRGNTNIGDMLGDSGFTPSRNDSLELLVRMQDGLVAEIVDSTLDQAANVVINVERALL